MEDARFFIMLILIFVLAIVYWQFIGTTAQQPTRPPQPTPKKEQTEPPDKKPSDVQPKPVEKKPAVVGVIENAVLRVGWRSSYADVSSLVLIEKDDERYLYPERKDKKKPLKLLDSDFGSSAFGLLDKDGKTLFEGAFEVKERSARSVRFLAESETLAFEKELRIFDRYDLKLRITFTNKTDKAVALKDLRVVVAANMERERESRGYSSVLIGRKGEDGIEVENISFGKAEKDKPYTEEGSFEFCGFSNHYFAVLLRPDDPATESLVRGVYLEKLEEGSKEQNVLNYAVSALLNEIELEPHKAKTLHFLVFVGPKAPEVLEEYSEYGFDNIVSYGWLPFLSKLFLAILKGIHFVIPNWGVAIIILTLIVRCGLHPISRKQQLSMLKYQQKMQKLQPEMERLKKKYKNNRQKLNQEMLKLMRKHGVSIFPAGGCLLMLLQIPVFIGLWGGLNASIDLRQAGFCLWITDLSQPDQLLKLPFNLPLLGTPYLNLLPVLMIVAMFVQTRLQPQTGEAAQQQKVMSYFMFIFLAFIFYSLPSGLVLYFLASTVVGIVESRITRRHLETIRAQA